MIRFVLLLLLATAPAFAAENVCNVPEPNTTVFYDDFLPLQKSACREPIYSESAWGTNSAGVVGWRYCKSADGKTYYPQWGAATWQYVWSTSLGRELAIADKRPTDALVQSIAARHATTPLASPLLTPVWCPFQLAMHAGIPVVARVPPPPTAPWATSSMFVYTLSPALSLSTVRVALGVACDCTRPFNVITTAYCTYVGAPTPAHLARCKRV